MTDRANSFDPSRTYTVEARRSGDWWALTVPGLRGVHSQVRRLEQAADMIREAIGLAFDVDPASVLIEDPVPIISPELDDLLRTTLNSRHQLVELRARADGLTCRLAREMTEAGIPVRDVATVLGISFQHAAKLAKRAS